MTVPEKVYSAGLDAGSTKEALCALLANLQAESAFIANNVEDQFGVSDDAYTRGVDSGSISESQFVNDGHGYGLAQWTYYTRKQMLYNYAKQNGKSIGDLDMQISFIFYEMKSSFSGIWNKMVSSHDLYDLTKALLYTWENPDQKESKLAGRYNIAQEWMNKVGSFQNNSGSAHTPSTGGGTGRMTKEEAIAKLLNWARGEIGYHEKASNSQLDDKTANPGSGNWNKYSALLDSIPGFYNSTGKNGFAWCECFVDAGFVICFGPEIGREMLCQPTYSAGAGCLYSAQYYKQAGRWRTSNPEPGDQIFFTYAPGEYSHTGIVETVSNGVVTTIEGNTSDQVARRQYQIGSSNIAGYGVPKWELATGSSSSGSVTPSQPSSGGSVTPSAPSSYDGIIRKGAKGAKVKELQENLIKLGFSCGPDGADGDFGNNTRAAVIEFQKKAFPNEPVELDGEVGPKTQAAIEKALAEMDKPEEKEETTETATAVLTPTPAKEYNTGDYVNFKGGPYYSSPLTTTALHATPGRAKIISIRRGTKHPYRLQRISKQGTNVNGWVDADSIEEN